jgi:hypothetical protein
MAHAARSRRWRQRRREREHACRDAAALHGGAINFVTHQGSPMSTADAPLATHEPSDECAGAVTGAVASPITAQCQRCAAPLSPWVRHGFLRHGMRRWPARVIEPSP